MRKVRYVLLGPTRVWRNKFQGSNVVVCSTAGKLAEAVERTSPESLWISRTSRLTDRLVKHLAEVVRTNPRMARRFGDFLMIKSPRTQILPALENLFGHVIGETTMLCDEQLAEVLSETSGKRQDVFIGGTLDVESQTLTLLRGDFKRTILPLSMFPPNPKCEPDFSQFELDDYGNTLRFGDYESTADVVLWETDPEYRARVKAKERATATGFGASLRRLRKQRRLSQSQLGVPRRTIARIENGEVAKPRGQTLKRIADALHVVAEEIETY